MRGVMQWLHEKMLPIGKRCALAIILAGLVAFGAIDFAHLFLPVGSSEGEEWMTLKEWMMLKTRVLEWGQFLAYLAGVGVVLWKWRSIKVWCNAILVKVNSGDSWSTPDMIWTGLAVMGVVGFAPLLLPNEWIASDASVLKRLQFAAYLVGGGFLVWQLRISNRRASIAEKGNITERFKNAIEFLDDKADSVQIGGVYTLYHVAKEAEEYKDAVLKILIAHLRKMTAGKEKPADDRIVMAIWDALFARQNEKPLFETVDLTSMNLKGIGLGGNIMYDYNISTMCAYMRLDITDAFFKKANLNGVVLWHSICKKTIFNDASCIGTDFHAVKKFQGAEFINTDLTQADFRKSSITAEQLLEAKTLYQAKLPPDVHEEILRRKPELFDPPAKKK